MVGQLHAQLLAPRFSRWLSRHPSERLPHVSSISCINYGVAIIRSSSLTITITDIAKNSVARCAPLIIFFCVFSIIAPAVVREWVGSSCNELRHNQPRCKVQHCHVRARCAAAANWG